MTESERNLEREKKAIEDGVIGLILLLNGFYYDNDELFTDINTPVYCFDSQYDGLDPKDYNWNPEHHNGEAVPINFMYYKTGYCAGYYSNLGRERMHIPPITQEALREMIRDCLSGMVNSH